jgi:acyl-CoA reductase-like NAD-dependent aldehyde dehydrogenase
LPVAFQASLFTRDINVALTAAKLLDASAVLINDHTAFRTDWMPFAGRRQSGLGTGGIPYTMRDITLDKMVVFNFQDPFVGLGCPSPKSRMRLK